MDTFKAGDLVKNIRGMHHHYAVVVTRDAANEKNEFLDKLVADFIERGVDETGLSFWRALDDHYYGVLDNRDYTRVPNPQLELSELENLSGFQAGKAMRAKRALQDYLSSK